MKKRQLGHTDLKVSEICLGTMTWGSQNTQDEAFQQMDFALDQDVTFWDTAELYPVPPSAKTVFSTEIMIGNYFKARQNRDKVVLATKVKGGGVPHIRGGSPLTPEDIDIALEGSLKRLNTDYIDLYQLHWPNRGTYHFGRWNVNFESDPEKLRDEHLNILRCLDKHMKAGKIRHIGVSDDTCWGTMTYCELSRQHNLPKIVSVQNEYSLLKRSFELDFHEVAKMEGTGLLAWSPLVCGAISGKYLDGQMPKGSRKDYSGSRTFRDTDRAENAIRAYIEIAERHNIDVCQMSIAFLLTRPFMTSVIIGATKMD
ncbi:MAG: aldo/keto reductase, partial [Pseudomonadota bacterium]